jgi:hypothetical protein
LEGANVNDSPFPQPPAWVCKRDGQSVPFDADKISRALFAASESLGRPDAFLARELADGVVHFLTLENDEATPTTEQISELVIKVVRELGQPALAEAFARFGERRTRVPVVETPAARPASPASPPNEIVFRFAAGTPLSEVVPACVRDYVLQTVFTRDLVAAHGEGLLTLTGLDAPTELSGYLLGPPLDSGRGIVTALENVRRFAGHFAVLDGPEYSLASGHVSVDDFARDLAIGLRLTGLRGVVNLNCATPPSWAGDLAEGPLFAGQNRTPATEQLQQLADDLANALLQPSHSIPREEKLRIDWHLGERDFEATPARRERLHDRVRQALEGKAIGFVFDRPRRPTALAEGIDRQHPALLSTVGVHLPRLAMQPGINGDTSKFLAKLGSLARLALSAGVQKREYLRQLERNRSSKPLEQPALTSGFLLDRARLMVAPIGLDQLVQSFLSKGLSAGGAALEFGRQIVQRLRDVLRQDGRNTHLDTCIDGPFRFQLTEGSEPQLEEAAGLTPWDSTAALKNQLRAAGVLQGVSEHGTLALFVPEASTPEQAIDWLRAAWQQSDVLRLRIVKRLNHESHESHE